MSNHIHLAAVAGEQTFADLIRPVHAPFATWMNRAYDRVGPLFVRGPKSFATEWEDVRGLIAYVHNNPVRAGVCGVAAESDWTSHRAYVGEARVPSWLHASEGLAYGGFDDGRTFDDWVNEPARETSEFRFTEDYYKEMEQAARAGAAAEAETTRRRRDIAQVIVATTAEMLGLDLDVLRSRKRGSSELVGRAVAVSCASEYGVSGNEIALALGLSQQRVSDMRREARDATPSREMEALCAMVARRVEGERGVERGSSIVAGHPPLDVDTQVQPRREAWVMDEAGVGCAA